MGKAIDNTDKRSTFVTAVAWVFLALSAFGTLITALQNIMITLMFPVEEMRMAVREAETQEMPAIFRLMVENIRLFFFIPLAVSVATLASSIGMLLRKNWARLTFIGVMAFGVAAMLASTVMPFFVVPEMEKMQMPQEDDFDRNFRLVWKIMMGAIAVINLMIAGLFMWIIKRLVSPAIRSEFVGSSAGNQR